MVHWNYRIVKRAYVYDDGEKEWEFSIRETYYNDAGEITAFSAEPRALTGETLEYLKENLERCLRAIEKPILEEDGFVFAKDGYVFNEEEVREKLKNELSSQQINAIIDDIKKDLHDQTN